jgi:hypothetical protein
VRLGPADVRDNDGGPARFSQAAWLEALEQPPVPARMGILTMGEPVNPKWKLEPVLVPKPLVRRSVYRALRRGAKWRKIREDARALSGGPCEICAAPERPGMICHEDWEYDDATHVARLTRFLWICPDCNAVIHLGEGPRSWTGGLENDPARFVFDHMITVNGMDFDEATASIVQANRIWQERSKHDWTVTVAREILQQYPFLADLTL